MSSVVSALPLSPLSSHLPNRTTTTNQGLFKAKGSGYVTMETPYVTEEASFDDAVMDVDDGCKMELEQAHTVEQTQAVDKLSDVVFSEEDIDDILQASGDKDNKSPLECSVILSDADGNESDAAFDTAHENEQDGNDDAAPDAPMAESTPVADAVASLLITEDRRASSPRLSYVHTPDTATMTRPEMVAKEIVLTEKAYVNDLQEIIEGYLFHIFHHGVNITDVEKIFSNLEEIYDFNKSLLDDLELCASYPAKVAECFLEKAKGFNALYLQYCTSYPEASAFLSEIIFECKEVSTFFQDRQKALGHALPIESYLLKPVQRITKYHLLLKDMFKHTPEDDPGIHTIKAALDDMADVADYINEMQRLQEDIVKVHDVLETIVGIESLDVYKTGRLVLENTFRVQGYRGDRHLFLFEKVLLICKKIDDGMFHFKTGIMCSNMMLVESISKEPLSFRIIRFDNQKVIYNIQARSYDIKKAWVQHLKRLLLENHPSLVPVTAKQAILGSSNNGLNRSKFNTISLDAHDDISEKMVRQQKARGSAALSGGKENRSSPSTALKRELCPKNEEHAEKEKRISLNSKAKDFLDKKSKALLLITSGDKGDRGRPWRFRKSTKQPKSPATQLPDSMVTTLGNGDALMLPSLLPGRPNITKSKSMDSLRTAPILDTSFPPSPQLGVDDTQPESATVDAARQQIHRLSMLHDLFSIDLEASWNGPPASGEANSGNASSLDASIDEPAGQRPRLEEILDDEFIPPLPTSSPLIRRDQARPRRATLQAADNRKERKHRSATIAGGMALESVNPLIRCHSTELRSRLGSSRETMIIDDDEDDLGTVLGGDPGVAADTTTLLAMSKRASNEALPETTTEDSPHEPPPESDTPRGQQQPLSLSSDEESCESIQNTIRRVNEAFSSMQRGLGQNGESHDPAAPFATTCNHQGIESNHNGVPRSAFRPRARSAFATVGCGSDTPNVSDEEPMWMTAGEASGSMSELADELLSTPIRPASGHARSNSEGSSLLVHRLDSVQSELDEACEDFSLVVAEMESPNKSSSLDARPGRTPVKYALVTKNDEEADGNQAEMKTINERKPSAGRKPSVERKPSAERASSLEFRRVSDRIREYTQSVKADTQRHKAAARAKSQSPRLNELFESLDTSTEGASPVYRDQRRRFSRKLPLKRSESQPDSAGSVDNEMRTARTRATSDVSRRVALYRWNNENAASSSSPPNNKTKSMSLPRHMSLHRVSVTEETQAHSRLSLSERQEEHESPAELRDSDIRARRWSQECGSIVTGPKHSFLAPTPTPSSSSAWTMRSPSLRHIQRSTVHRRVKEYIENVVKPAQKELRQRHTLQRTGDERDGSEATADTGAIEAVEKGTVQRLKGKFDGPVIVI